MCAEAFLEPRSSASEHDGDCSTVQTALAILGLGALGGIVAAVGGGGEPKDKAAPSAPAGLDIAAADDTGSSNSNGDNITTATSGLRITGQAEAGARVELFDGSASVGTATADAIGNFLLTYRLSPMRTP
jgi:hypothetical protein